MAKVALNSDREMVKEIQECIKKNEGFCCCSIVHDPEYKCMCADFRQMIRENRIGETCHCGLYTIVDDNQTV